MQAMFSCSSGKKYVSNVLCTTTTTAFGAYKISYYPTFIFSLSLLDGDITKNFLSLFL